MVGLDRESSVHIVEAMGQAFPHRLAHVGDSEPSARAAASESRSIIAVPREPRGSDEHGLQETVIMKPSYGGYRTGTVASWTGQI